MQQLAVVDSATLAPSPREQEPATVSLSGDAWKTLDQNSELGSKLSDYLSNHREFASPMGVAPVGPHALTVRYDAAR